MSISLKPLSEQVIVVTGASSGIGLAVAKAAALKKAKVALLARSGTTLQEIVKEINEAGGEAIAIVCDVSDRDQVDHAVNCIINRFERINTWINNAGQGLYGRLDEVSTEDSRRLFDVNFWGVVNGSLAALPHLKKDGGALINIGSEVSDSYPPLLGMYAASKHAVKGFTDALRVEIEQVDKAPVAVTLIQPTAVDTPFPQHARNFMDKEPMLPNPRLDPRQVASAILKAATHTTRNKTVGTMSLINVTMARILPSLGDRMAAGLINRQQYDEPPRHPQGILNDPSESFSKAGRIYGTGGKEPGKHPNGK